MALYFTNICTVDPSISRVSSVATARIIPGGVGALCVDMAVVLVVLVGRCAFVDVKTVGPRVALVESLVAGASVTANCVVACAAAA